MIQLTKERDGEIFKYRGQTFVALGLYDRGIQDFFQSLHLYPKSFRVRYSRARAYALKGQTLKALKDIEDGLKEGPNPKFKRELLALKEAIITGEPIPYEAPMKISPVGGR
jgi:tetratricopeptide (TPR) repeat protein